MRWAWLSGAVVFVALALPPPASAQEAPPDSCVEPAPCVYVTPDPELDPVVDELYVFHGRGWRPRGRVEASLGEFCPPGAFCDNNLITRRFRADGRGRFTFRLLYHWRRRPVLKPSAVGGDDHDGPIAHFSQRRRRGSRVWKITRDAIPIPPISTPEERAEAAAVAAATLRAARALDRRERAASQASDRLFRRQKRACGDLSESMPPRAWRVESALTILDQDRTEVAVIRRELAAFAAELERLALRDPVLRAAAGAWIAAVRRTGRYPAEDSCTLLRRWARTGYARDARPIPPGASKQTLSWEIYDSEALDVAERRMRALGAGQTNALRFGGGLLEPDERLGELFG